MSNVAVSVSSASWSSDEGDEQPVPAKKRITLKSKSRGKRMRSLILIALICSIITSPLTDRYFVPV